MDASSALCRFGDHRARRCDRLRSAIVALIGVTYMGVTIPMAIRSEEAFLHRRFGPTYDPYRRAEAPPMVRRFSLAHARRNREYRAVPGSSAGLRSLLRGFCCRYNHFFVQGTQGR